MSRKRPTKPQDPPAPEGIESDKGMRALLRKSDRAVRLRQARDDGWPEGFAQLARTMVLAGLPMRRTKERQIVRELRLAKGKMTVTFAVIGKDAEMPYGNDVHLLHFLFDRLDPDSDYSFISWRTAREYLEWWGMDADSPKNQRDLRARWARLSNLVIQVVYDDGEVELQRTNVLFPTVALPKSVGAKRALAQRRLPGQEYGVWIDPEIWHDVARHRVPVPKRLLLEYRDDLITQRLAVFLGYRGYAARSESLIPWADLKSMLGSTDRSGRMFKSRVKDALREIHVWWPELEAEAEKAGVRIRPPARQLLPDGELHRKTGPKALK